MSRDGTQLDLFAPVVAREAAPAAPPDRPIPAESVESGAAVSGSLPESTVRRAVRRPRRPAGTSHPTRCARARPGRPWRRIGCNSRPVPRGESARLVHPGGLSALA